MLKALSIIIFTGLALAAGKQNQERKEPYQPKECSHIGSIYSGHENPNESLEPDQDILSICPTLTDSCCYKEAFFALHDKALDSIHKLEHFGRTYKSVLGKIVNAKSKFTEAFLNSYEKKLQEKYGFVTKYDYRKGHEEDEPIKYPSESIKTNLDALKKDLKYLKKNQASIESDLTIAIQYLSDFNSRYICALCTSDYQTRFENFRKRKTTKKLQLDMSMCPLIFEDKRSLALFRLDYSTGKLYNVIVTIFELRKGVGRRDSFITKDELSNINNIITKCAKGTSYLNKSECKNLCLGMGFFNKNVMVGLEKIIFAGELAVPHYFEGKEDLSEDEMNINYEENLKKYTLGVYLNPVPEYRTERQKYPIENMEKVMYWGKGFNLMKYRVVMHDKYFLKENEKSGLREYFKQKIEYMVNNSSEDKSHRYLVV